MAGSSIAVMWGVLARVHGIAVDEAQNTVLPRWWNPYQPYGGYFHGSDRDGGDVYNRLPALFYKCAPCLRPHPSAGCLLVVALTARLLTFLTGISALLLVYVFSSVVDMLMFAYELAASLLSSLYSPCSSLNPLPRVLWEV